jgi:hypothetical protein
MESIIGTYQSSIANLTLSESVLNNNTLILGEEGSGKTHLTSKIRNYVISNDVPTLYLDFSNPNADEVESHYRESDSFNYMRFDESDAFDAAIDAAIAERKHLYVAVNPDYFGKSRHEKSKLSCMLQKEALLENYYYFFHEIAQLNGFYTKFDDFLLYTFSLLNLKKFGLTFLTQPHPIFEDQHIKLLFKYLYVGRCSNVNYYNTSILRNLSKHTFYYQFRMEHPSILFNNIKGDIVKINA